MGTKNLSPTIMTWHRSWVLDTTARTPASRDLGPTIVELGLAAEKPSSASMDPCPNTNDLSVGARYLGTSTKVLGLALRDLGSTSVGLSPAAEESGPPQ